MTYTPKPKLKIDSQVRFATAISNVTLHGMLLQLVACSLNSAVLSQPVGCRLPSLASGLQLRQELNWVCRLFRVHHRRSS